MNVAEWMTALGEVAIAVVIVWEMEVGRRDRFLAEAGQIENYEGRGRLYARFCDTEGETVEAKSQNFCDHIWKSASADSTLKQDCERQIILFGRLAQIKRRAVFYRKDYVKLFPHAVVIFWIMVNPYIRERRARTGEWWASDFESLAKQCLRFLLKQDAQARLTLFGSDPGREQDFVIPNDYLVRLRTRFNSKTHGVVA